MKLPQQAKPISRQLNITSFMPILQGSEIHMSSCSCTFERNVQSWGGGDWRPTQNNCPRGAVPYCDPGNGRCQCVSPSQKSLLEQYAHFNRIWQMEGLG